MVLRTMQKRVIKERGEAVGNIELTILMPCLNEEKTIGECIKESQRFIDESRTSAEILIADNGSTDASVSIATQLGARVISVMEKGYGNALIGGIRAAKGEFIIMGDCDMSYDFYNLGEFLAKLREGYGLVMGNRFAGGIEKGAMPFSHRYIGVPFLSWLGRLKYKTDVKDFHCGLRGFSKEEALKLDLKCDGMEFATEIIGKFARSGAKITQIPTTLRKDKRNHKPHLNTIRDGFRHLIYIIK